MRPLLLFLLMMPMWGDGTKIKFPAAAGGYYNDKIGDLSDIWFKNKVAGSNTSIVALLTIPVSHVQDALRVGGVIV